MCYKRALFWNWILPRTLNDIKWKWYWLKNMWCKFTRCYIKICTNDKPYSKNFILILVTSKNKFLADSDCLVNRGYLMPNFDICDEQRCGFIQVITIASSIYQFFKSYWLRYWWYISGWYRRTFLQYQNDILPCWLKMLSRVS